jgi:CubicO group peptidase (beta-lactamase class C family)
MLRLPLPLSVVLAFGVFAHPATAADVRPVFPGKTWERRTPAEVGLDAAKLREFAKRAGGRGCAVRNGYLVYTWGDHKKRGDVASAAKPVYSFFLFHALETKRIAGLDEKVVKYEPRLASLNAKLGHKDRNITWRHLANQTSCYGVTEPPGTAFDYSDWQMALFWDLLFQKVYKTNLATVDRKVLHPILTDPLQCEDKPTFMAFGTKNRPGRLAISPRDFARFGLLYLHRGKWRGKQLLSEKLATMAVTDALSLSVPRTKDKRAEMLPKQRSIGGGNNQTDHNGGYSWLWWLNGKSRDGKRWWQDAPADAFFCLGHGGRRGIACFPSQQIVVSWNDARQLHSNRKLGNAAFRFLVRSIRRRN